MLYVIMLTCQQVAISLQIGPDWAYFYLTNIEFILLLNCIHSFVLEFAVVSSGVWSIKIGIY